MVVQERLFIRELGNVTESFHNSDSVNYEILKLLDPEVQAHPQVVEYFEELEKKKKQNELEGKQYLDYTLFDPNGKTMRISDFAGKSKYLYLDFWVSWCSLCIAEMPTLKKVYEIYKGQGLQVISISLDSREGDWKKGIERIDVPWIHLSDLKGDNSEIKQLYNIIGIPHGVLINEKGEIEVAKANAKVLEIMSKSIF